ncbi:MAG: hypothetical protein JNM62_10610 [Flavobacteriales bacterium]|nr:hypothetical protein [Flavobacteriales bacterium]
MDFKFLRTNLIILLVYAVIVQLLSLAERNGGAMLVMVFMMIAVAIHVGVLLLGALVKLIVGDRGAAGMWLLSAVILGVVGFGTCWAGGTLAETYSGPTHF